MGHLSPPRIVYDDRLTSWLAGKDDEVRQARWEALRAHEAAAVAEGFCPAHQVPLRPVEMRGVPVAGHCPPCGRYWWYDPDEEAAGWSLDHNPFTGACRPPHRDRT